MNANDFFADISFSFIVLILLVMRDVLKEMRAIRRELEWLKRKDGEQHE